MRDRLVKKTALLLATSSMAALMMLAPPAHADLQDEMDSLFGEMSNTTDPAVFETQRRGVISGGRYTTKAKIFDEQLIAFSPPSWKGGCGGIDMFNGSFSFISADQIVQLLRQVAANAKGYAFQIALDTVCPQCSNHIDAFQKKIQELNQYLGNSCQMAQGIVDNAPSSFENLGKTTASIGATLNGAVSDFFSAREETETAKTPEEQLTNEEMIKKELQGNLVWNQLQKQNTKAWFRYGDDELLETMMSMTGTLIRVEPTDDGNGSKTQPLITKPPKADLLRAMLEGGNVDVYKCDDDKCMAPTNQTITLEGYGSKVEDLLLGTASSPGVIAKYAHNSGTLSTAEKQLVASLPAATGTIVRNLAILSEESARIFAINASNAIALNMVYTTADELFRAVSLVISQSQAPHQNKAYEQVMDAQRQVREDFRQLQSEYGDVNAMIPRYNEMIKNIRKQRYTLSTLARPQSTKE